MHAAGALSQAGIGSEANKPRQRLRDSPDSEPRTARRPDTVASVRRTAPRPLARAPCRRSAGHAPSLNLLSRTPVSRSWIFIQAEKQGFVAPGAAVAAEEAAVEEAAGVGWPLGRWWRKEELTKTRQPRWNQNINKNRSQGVRLYMCIGERVGQAARERRASAGVVVSFFRLGYFYP
ncbi:Hypothetical predicted protein [Cloeon dipterum]|uniref:Uncharacterized protein n=1 Tax=Cloeon dipterum TaxID=197152 RepID=A0A8S1CUT9_9INSE|nr:Hypothetical predicted protein [Cloeon dipterum]